MKAFKNKFDKYACIGDSITIDLGAVQIKARIEQDIDHNIDDDDCHNVDQSVTGCNEEQQHKLIKAREAWYNNQWEYVGIVLSVWADDICIDSHVSSLWGIECNYPNSDNSYLSEVANDLLSESWEDIKKTVKEYKQKVNAIDID